MAAPLKLISHKLCPYVQRAVIALTEKGVPFERIDIDLANKPDWFLKISPLGKVPVLLVETGDGEVALFESNVICEYIEETQGGAKLHPQDPLQRAQHRAWMEFGSTILSELWGLETTGDPAVFETKRKAVAASDETIVLAVGGRRGEAYRVPPGGELFDFFEHYNKEDYEGALAACHVALEKFPGNALILYNIACMQSKLGRDDEALETLRTALEGWPQFKENAQGDDDFASLREDTRFLELVS